MIYTVTFNPAVDYAVNVNDFTEGEINRTKTEDVFFGGKGINVSLMLKSLGIKSKALGFIAGFTGEAIENGLKNCGIETDFIKLKSGLSRINVKIKSNKETEINGNGPSIDEQALSELFTKLKNMGEGDILVLAGSIPCSLPNDIYEKILNTLSDKDIKVVVDASNNLLLNTLKFKPFLIKPNVIELGEIFSLEFQDDDKIINCAKQLQNKGAQNVLVSKGADGAILIDVNGEAHKINAVYGQAINSVGAGDSMVAGFLAGYIKTGNYNYALKLGSAAGSATAFSPGIANVEKVEEIFKELT